MRIKWIYTLVFFSIILGLSLLIVPMRHDLVSVYQFSEEYNDAFKLLEKMEGKVSNNPRTRLSKGTLYFSVGQYEEAYRELYALTRENPKLKAGWEALLMVSEKSVFRKGMIDALEGLSKLEPENVEYLSRLTHLYRIEQDKEKSKKVLRRLVKLAPAKKQYWEELIELESQTEPPESAVYRLQNYLKHYPQDEDKADRLANLLVFTGNKVDAVKLFRSRIELNNADEEKLVRYMMLLQDQKDYKTAETVYPQVLKIENGRQLYDDVLETYIYDQRGQDALHMAEYQYAHEELRSEKTAYYLAYAYILTNQDEKAHDLMRKEIRYTMPFDEYSKVIQEYYYSPPKPQEKIVKLEKMIKKKPTMENQMALIYLALNNKAESKALAQSRALVKSEPNNKDYFKVYLDVLESTSSKQELLAVLKKAHKRWPRDQKIREQLLDAYEWNEDYIGMISHLEYMIKKQPNNMKYRLNLARAYSQSGDYDRAVIQFRDLSERGYTAVDFTGEYVFALEKLEDRNKAIAHAERLRIKTKSKNIEVLFLLNSLYEDSGQHAKANEVQKEISKLNPTAAIYNSIAWGKYARHKQKEAIFFFKKALKLDPNFQDSLLGIATAYSKVEPAKSRQYLARLERQKRKDANLVYSMAGVYEEIGDEEDAQAKYLEYLKLTSTKKVKTEEVALRRSNAQLRTGQKEEAWMTVKQAQKLHPKGYELWLSEAEILIAMEKYSKADRVLRSSKLSRGPPEARGVRYYQLRYIALSGLKKWKEAAAVSDELVALDPKNMDYRLDNIFAHDKSGQWKKGLVRENKARKITKSRRYREQIFEYEESIFEKYGVYAGAKWEYIESAPENWFNQELHYRWFLSEKSSLAVYWTKWWVSDTDIDLDVSPDTYMLQWRYFLNPEWVTRWGFSYYPDPHLRMVHLSGESTAVWNDWTLDATGYYFKRWLFPADAVLYDGTYHELSGTVSSPTFNNWFFRVNGGLREYHLFRGQHSADEQFFGANIGWRFFTEVYGHDNPIRVAVLELGYAGSRIQQTPETAALVPLTPKSDGISLSLFLHMLPNDHSLWDLTFLIGGDASRNISFGRSLGITSRYVNKLNDTMRLISNASYFTEAPANQQAAGAFWSVDLGVQLNYE